MDKLIEEIETIIANAKKRREENTLNEEMNIKEIKIALDYLIHGSLSEGRKQDA